MSTPLVHQNTIIAPVITEKSYGLAKLNKYAFKVAPSASKSQIKKAIKDLFNVDAISINTVKKASRRIRSMKTGRHLNTTDVKKAIVQLKEGQTIDIFNALKS